MSARITDAKSRDSTTASGRPSRLARIIVLLVAVDLVLRLAVASRPYDALDNLALPDDAYLSLTIARSIGSGWGPLFGPGPTNGFQPLHVFMMAPVFALGDWSGETPVRVSLVLLALFDAGILLMIAGILRRWGVRASLVVVAMLAWIVSPDAMLQTANGLETQIAVFLALLSVFVYCRSAGTLPVGLPAAVGLGTVLGLAALARIDAGFLAAAVGTALLIHARRAGSGGGEIVRIVAGLVVGFTAVYSPWLWYSYHHTGDLFPVSGRAVRHLALVGVGHQPSWQNAYWPALRTALITVWNNSGGSLVVSVLSGVALIVGRRRQRTGRTASRPSAVGSGIVAAFGALLIAGYSVYAVAVWYFDRYLFPVMPLILLVAVGLGDRALRMLVDGRGRDRRMQLIAAAFVACCLLLPSLLSPSLGHVVGWSEAPDRGGYRAIGRFVDENFQPGSIIGAPQTGAIAYFAPLVTAVNLDGVVNGEAYRAMRERRLYGYARDVGCSHIIGWPRNIDLIRLETVGFSEDDWEYVGRARGIKSWNYPWEIYRVKYR